MRYVREGDWTARVGTTLVDNAYLRIGEPAVEDEHIGRHVDRFVVYTESRIVAPIVRLDGAVHRGVQSVVAPGAGRIGRIGNGKQELRYLAALRPQRGGDYYPAVRIVIVDRAWIEDFVLLNDVGEPLREGHLRDHI